MATLEAWGAAGRNYVIHPETLDFFRRAGAIGGTKSYDEVTIPEFRAMAMLRSDKMAGYTDFHGADTQLIVPPTEGNPDGIPVTVYKPSTSGPSPAILVYFHGGGHVIGTRRSHAPVLKMLAMRAGCVVVNVEYRLAPEHRLPAGLNDCRDVTRWALRNKATLGGSEESQVGVGGDSAGGHLASSIAHDVKGLAFQLLVYPHTDLTLSSPSYTEFESTPGLNTKLCRWFMSQYLGDASQTMDPATSPYHRPSFAGLPHALLVLAELDPLRDDGIEYGNKLSKAGVATETLMVKGAPHAFFTYPGHFKELGKECYQKCVDFLKSYQPS